MELPDCSPVPSPAIGLTRALTKGVAVDSSELDICEVVLVVGFAIVDVVGGTG